MRCLKCSTDNSEVRKFCRECGSIIGNFCPRCGFCNSLTDKYCGGCGVNLADTKTSEGEKVLAPQITDMTAKRYTTADISELVDKNSQKTRKKEIKDTDEVSQNLIDSIFDSDAKSDKKKT